MVPGGVPPWIDQKKIRVGPIDAEQRRAIDAQMVRLLAAHWRGTNVRPAQRVSGAVTKPKRKCKCSPEHGDRLRAYNTARAAARALKRGANARIKSKFAFSKPMRRESSPRRDLAAA